jgi:hypothetical protein
MNQKVKLVIFWVLMIFTAVYTTESCEERLTSFIELNQTGRISIKYPKRAAKGVRAVTLIQGKKELEVNYIGYHDIFEIIELGDSIYKPSGSSIATIYKVSGDTIVYEFTCN